MEAHSILSIVAIASVAFAGTSLAYGAITVYGAQTRTSAVRKHTLASGSLSRILRTGIPLHYPLSRRACAFGFVQTQCHRFSWIVSKRSLETNDAAIASLLCAGALCAMVLGVVQQSLAPIGLFAASLVAFSAWVSSVEEREHDSMRNDLPDALRAMSACFHAGFTLPQTFEQLQKETTGPLHEIFARVTQSMKTGKTAHEALSDMRSSTRIPELAFIAVALEVQHESGGSMQHVLDATSDMLKSELELKRSLKVQTAQARLSARVVVAVTIGLMAVLIGLTDDFFGPFFSSVSGFVLLGAAVGMQALGVYLVRRMLNVEGA